MAEAKPPINTNYCLSITYNLSTSNNVLNRVKIGCLRLYDFAKDKDYFLLLIAFFSIILILLSPFSISAVSLNDFTVTFCNLSKNLFIIK